MGSDSSDNLYQQKLHGLQIMHVPTGKIVEFKAFLTDLSDNYTSNWKMEEAIGRMDPIATFQGTKRNITVAWTVPAFSAEEAQTNLMRASRFFEMLYPTYTSGGGGAGQMNAAPLLRVKFANLICSVKDGSPSRGIENGLLGFINGSVSLQPDLNTGFWDESIDQLYSMSFSLGFNFTVLHTHELGWDASARKFRGNRGGRTFPYGSPTYFESQNKIAQLGEGGTSTPTGGSRTTTPAPNDPSVDTEAVAAKTKEDNTNAANQTSAPAVKYSTVAEMAQARLASGEQLLSQEYNTLSEEQKEAYDEAHPGDVASEATAAKSTGPPPLPKNWRTELPYNDKRRVAYRNWYKKKKRK